MCIFPPLSEPPVVALEPEKEAVAAGVVPEQVKEEIPVPAVAIAAVKSDQKPVVDAPGSDACTRWEGPDNGKALAEQHIRTYISGRDQGMTVDEIARTLFKVRINTY